MAYIGKTVERNMYFGASKQIIMQARGLRKNMTDAEKILWKNLHKKKLDGFVFRRQHPIDIFIVDFYCHELRLVIELDGGIHKLPEIAEYDKGREAELKDLGLKILRFSNEEVLKNVTAVIKSIKQVINDSRPPP